MSVLTLADAKIYLNLTNTTHDAELQGFIDSAESSIANRCGPLTPAAQAARVRGSREKLLLSTTPAVSLTSVTPVSLGAVALDVTTLYLSPAGVLESLRGGSFDADFYDVVYVAGYSPTPSDLLLAVKEHVRHLWDTQRGSARRPGDNTAPTPGSAYAFNWRVNELIAPYLRGGFG